MKLMEQDRLKILVVFFFFSFFLVCKFLFLFFFNMLFIDEVSPCKLQTLFKVCSYYCFSHREGGNEGSVLLCLFKMR